MMNIAKTICPMESAFVLQDRKRLPARFFASISGALNTRAA